MFESEEGPGLISSGKNQNHWASEEWAWKEVPKNPNMFYINEVYYYKKKLKTPWKG